MPVLKILEYPDPRLRTRAVPVESVDDDIRRLVADMFETMYTAPGVGLAATQVDVHKRILVADVSEAKDEPKCLINPKILEKEGNLTGAEGCLSVPGVTEEVERAERVRVTALGQDGQPYEIEATGLLAVCIQHEIDHLEGKLFVDYLSELKRRRIKKKLTKSRKRDAEDQNYSKQVPLI
jgi:peptide deformylase